MPWRKGNKLKLVGEGEAPERTREIYDETKQALGVPHVNVIFQAFAAYPIFFDLHWRTFRPLLETQEFFDLAERLRGHAYTRVHTYFAVPDFCAQVDELRFSPGAKDELTRVVELFHYNNPPLLLIAAAQLQAFDNPVGEDREARRPARHPMFSERPILVEEDTAGPNIRKIYDDIKRTLGLPFVNTDYRAFARWPDFLLAYWEVLRKAVQSPLYNESMYVTRDTAWSLVREFPLPVELTVSQLNEAGMADEEISSLVRLTELFVNALSGLVLNLAMAKIGMEGGNVQASAEAGEAQPSAGPQRAA
jgi:hypothetical protein